MTVTWSMSALAHYADLHWTSREVREVPEAAVSNRSKTVALFDHLVGADEKRFRNGQSECLCSLEVYHQLEFGRQLNRQVRGVCTLENEINICCCAPEQICRIVAERHQPPALREVAIAVNRREVVSDR